MGPKLLMKWGDLIQGLNKYLAVYMNVDQYFRVIDKRVADFPALLQASAAQNSTVSNVSKAARRMEKSNQMIE